MKRGFWQLLSDLISKSFTKSQQLIYSYIFSSPVDSCPLQGTFFIPQAVNIPTCGTPQGPLIKNRILG